MNSKTLHKKLISRKVKSLSEDSSSHRSLDESWEKQLQRLEEERDNFQDTIGGVFDDIDSIIVPYGIIKDGQTPGSERGPIPDDENEKTRASNLAEFRKHAEANQWKTRRDRGLPWRMDVFEYIREVYGEWIAQLQGSDSPVTQNDLKAVDDSLYQRFQVEASRSKVPDWLHLPPEKDAVLSRQNDPIEAEIIRRNRKRERERKAAYRASKNKRPGTY